MEIFSGQLEDTLSRCNKLKEEKNEVQKDLSQSERTISEMRGEMREKDQQVDRLVGYLKILLISLFFFIAPHDGYQ